MAKVIYGYYAMEADWYRVFGGNSVDIYFNICMLIFCIKQCPTLQLWGWACLEYRCFG